MNRTALRRLLAEEGLTKQAASKEEIAAWAMDSYKGDADFMVRSPSIGSGSFASHFWEGLRSHFIAQRFIRHIQESISEAKGEAAVSIESQDEGTDLYKRHAEKFLRDMYRAHGNGRQPFGDNWRAIDAWVLSKRPDLRTASQQEADKLDAEAEAAEQQADADRAKADAARMAAQGHRLLRRVNPEDFQSLEISAAYETPAGERWHNNLMKMDPRALDNKGQWNDATLTRFAEKVEKSRGTPITQIRVYGRTLDGKLTWNPLITWSREDGFYTDRETEKELLRLDREREKAEAQAQEEARLFAISGDGKGYTITTFTSWENDELDVDDDDWDNPDPATGESESTSTYRSLKDVFRALGTYGRVKMDRNKVTLTRDYDRRYNARGIYNLVRSYYEEVVLRRTDGKPFNEAEVAYLEANILPKQRLARLLAEEGLTRAGR